MSDPRQGGGSNNDEVMWVGLFILLMLLTWGIWTFARSLITYVILGLDLVQFHLIMPFMDLGSYGMQIYEWTLSMFDGRNDPNNVEWDQLMQVTNAVGNTMRLPISIALFAMSAYVYKFMKGRGFARNFSLGGGKGKGPSLAHYQAQEWGVVITGAEFDPSTKDPRLAPAKTPSEWIRDNNIPLDPANGLGREEAEAAFEAQMGEPWTGLDKAPAHVQIMAVLCALNAKRDKNKEKIKGDIAKLYARDPKTAGTKALKLIEPYLNDKSIRQEIESRASKHYYITTALYRLLLWARREGGVFASAEFLWLKPVDRNLWYVLQNVGRRAYHIEGAGPVAHYQIEFLRGKPVASPYIGSAVDGLEYYLEEQVITSLDTVFGNKSDI